MKRYQRPFRLRTNRVSYLIPGGRLIDRFLGLPEQPVSTDSQMWIASTVQSALDGAPDTRSRLFTEDGGDCFPELLAENPQGFLGEAHAGRYGSELGFLLKLLHSDDRLLVQTHPDKEKAKRYFGLPFGKTEAWYILEADKDACIYAGFRLGVTPEIFRTLIEQQDTNKILDCLHQYPIQRGDVIFIPAGMPHAMGEGSLVTEIQEPTDITLRAERVRPDGSMLPETALHGGAGMDALLDCFDFACKDWQTQRHAAFVRPRIVDSSPHMVEEELIGSAQTHCFGMYKVTCSGCCEKQNLAFKVGLVLSGAGKLYAGETVLPLKQGTEFFIPHGVKLYCYQTAGTLEILECYPPDE